MLWTDFGIIAMGLWTDTQHLGYVLRRGETGPGRHCYFHCRK